jgi:IS5 family transposase
MGAIGNPKPQENGALHPTFLRPGSPIAREAGGLAKREGVELRQSYLRVTKRAAIMVGRYSH